MGSYNYLLVLLSISIAVVASFTALDLARRREAATGGLRHVWPATAALAMGGGIWAMHFVGMLAFQMPGMEVSYDPGLTLASAALPVAVTGLSFLVTMRSGHSLIALTVGGVFMGLGIAAMHYLGMAAMQMSGEVSYRPAWVALSLLIAIGASTLALWLAGKPHLRRRLAGACALGIAVSGMHYVAMEGAVFTHTAGAAFERGLDLNPTALALGVAASTLVLLLLALIAAINDSRTAALREQEARASLEKQEQFRTLYSCTPLPLHALDRDARLEYVSNAWLELTGYRRDEVIGHPLYEFLSEASARQARSDWEELWATGLLAGAEYNLLTKGGQRLVVRAFARVEQGANGEFIRALGGLIDDTKTRLIEGALRQSQKMDALGKLTSGVAHDFNNLLAIVLTSLELLQRYTGGDPLQARLIDNAMSATKRGGALTQRLLAFTRQQSLRPRSVSLVELVEDMRELLQRSVGLDVTIETDFAAGLDDAFIDANQLEMVLLNLVINANDAMPGGGKLRIEVNEMPAPEGWLLPDSPLLCLAVTDTGSGMDEETLRRAADPFFTTKECDKGTGLGLSAAQGFAEQSGGRLAIQSSPGHGTRVELWLPTAQ